MIDFSNVDCFGLISFSYFYQKEWEFIFITIFHRECLAPRRTKSIEAVFRGMNFAFWKKCLNNFNVLIFASFSKSFKQQFANLPFSFSVARY